MAHQKIQVRGYTANLFSCPIFALFFCTCSHARRTSTKKVRPTQHIDGSALLPYSSQLPSGLSKPTLPRSQTARHFFCALVANTAHSIATGHSPRHRYNAGHKARHRPGHRQPPRLTEYTDSSPDRRAHPANDLPHRPCLPLSAHRAFLARQTICRPEFFP